MYLGIVDQTYSTSTWETKASGLLWIWGQARLRSESRPVWDPVLRSGGLFSLYI